jgi:CP family cyanate transporter-like MFS transporter
VGTLYESTGGWGLPLLLLGGFMLAQLTAGMFAGRDRVVEDEV